MKFVCPLSNTEGVDRLLSRRCVETLGSIDKFLSTFFHDSVKLGIFFVYRFYSIHAAK
jgi:hypothetical protein